MLSLPLIPPPEDQSTWLRTSRTRAESPPPSTAQAQGQLTHQQRQQRQQRDEEKKLQQARSPLALLAVDEAAIAQRKAAIRNFGAYWIRPPGVSKTLQAMIEEDAERREQEELERQERGLLDLQAQQQLEEAQQRVAETAAAEHGANEDGAEERDLDEEIPEADDEATFNEDSMMEGSSLAQQEQEQYEELEEAELTGAARDEEELGIEHERDLDDDVLDAGSYQHTDTEAEDMTSDSELQDSFALSSARRSSGRQRTHTASSQTASQQHHHSAHHLGQAFSGAQVLQPSWGAHLPRSPGSVLLSSPQVESSFADSSPGMQRTNRESRGAGRRIGF